MDKDISQALIRFDQYYSIGRLPDTSSLEPLADFSLGKPERSHRLPKILYDLVQSPRTLDPLPC